MAELICYFEQVCGAIFIFDYALLRRIFELYLYMFHLSTLFQMLLRTSRHLKILRIILNLCNVFFFFLSALISSFAFSCNVRAAV